MTGAYGDPVLGGLFDDPEIADLWSSAAQLNHYLRFEVAYSRALGTAGLVSAENAEAAATAINAARPALTELRAGAARDGLPIPNLIKDLRRQAGAHSHAVHTGATSQDVMDTALALTLKAQTDILLTRIGVVEQALCELSERHGVARLMARTRMQEALYITVADRIEAWRRPLLDHSCRLTGLREKVERVQLGGPVGTRQELGGQDNMMVRALAKDLGLHATEAAWHTDRSSVCEYGSSLSLIAGSLGKMGQDLCLMALAGPSQLRLSGGGGSSAMPHKSNPILAELMVTLARYTATQLSGLHSALVHEQERSGSAWMLEWMILPHISMATGRSLSVAAEIIRNIAKIGEDFGQN